MTLDFWSASTSQVLDYSYVLRHSLKSSTEEWSQGFICMLGKYYTNPTTDTVLLCLFLYVPDAFGSGTPHLWLHFTLILTPNTATLGTGVLMYGFREDRGIHPKHTSKHKVTWTTSFIRSDSFSLYYTNHSCTSWIRAQNMWINRVGRDGVCQRNVFSFFNIWPFLAP